MKDGKPGITELCEGCAGKVRSHYDGDRPLPHTCDECPIADDDILSLPETP